MPAKSAAQQKAAGAALSAKRGDTPKSKLKGASKQMEESMTEKELEEFAHTKRKGKPEHVELAASSAASTIPGRASSPSCSIVHWRGALSGRQRRKAVPWRNRSPVKWS